MQIDSDSWKRKKVDIGDSVDDDDDDGVDDNTSNDRLTFDFAKGKKLTLDTIVCACFYMYILFLYSVFLLVIFLLVVLLL